MPFSREFLERELDILNDRWAGRLSNEEAHKLLTDLWMDEYQARAVLRMADECERSK
jgi:hypothetical protein